MMNGSLNNPIDGLPSKDSRKLTKDEKKALKQRKKEDEKRKKEEEKRKKDELKKKEKEEKEAKKRREKEEKESKKTGTSLRHSSQDNLQSISKQGSSSLLGSSESSLESPRSGLASSHSSVDKRSTISGQGTPKLTRTKSGMGGTVIGGKTKKGRRPAKFKEKEFQILLDNLRQNNKQDTELDLENHYLDKWAAEDLAEVLTTNRTVTTVNLKHNTIGDEGVVHLAKMLEKNKTIRSFDIRFNGLTRKGTRHLINCLNNNVFITELEMDEETIELGELGLGNAQLDAITPGMREEIENLLDSNAGFQLLLEGKSDCLELPRREQKFINPHIIDRFPLLRVVDFSKNLLKEIPKEIGTLKKLEELLLQENYITRLPVEIGELPNLEVLDLSNNALVELPLAIANLPRLRRLLLAANKLDNIPRFALGGMKALEELDIRDNPLSQLSCMGSRFKSIINSGGYDTLEFIKRQNEGSEEVFRMKLMFVGNGNVGKTTLMGNLARTTKEEKALSTASGSVAPVQPRAKNQNLATDGIDIRMWNVKHPNQDKYKDKSINFSCWDFAGQEVYYATHGFFLSTRAIYLLIFNLLESEEESQIEYWLQSIGSRTENAPVILVGTHAEDRACTKEYVDHYFDSIKRKYGHLYKLHIQAHYAISNETQKGLMELKNQIVDLALAQPYMPDTIPLAFLSLEEKIGGARQTLNPPLLPWYDYKRMTLEAKIPEESITLATKFLNDLGSLLWFNDKELQDVVIVDPQWITKTFATVVSLKFGFIKDGILNCSDLPQLWKPPTHPTHLHNKLVAMLEKFQVMCRLHVDNADKILIPCLLPDRLPDDVLFNEHWPEFEHIPQAGRVYNFEFVPLGFFSRLIVRFMVSNSFTPLLYWKQGIVLSKDTERVKLSIRKNSRHKTMPWCLELWVRGPKPARHLTRLVQNIDTLVLDWLRVKFEATVPCVHCIKEQSPDPYQFPLPLVEQAVTAGQTQVKCRGIKDVLVSALAPDVALSEFNGARVDYNDIKVVKQIGEGGFAKVYKAVWNDEIIALKQLTLDTSSTAESLGFDFEDAVNPLDVFKEFRAEVLLMSDMVHPNIMGVRGLCMSPFCMLLEFCSMGSLYDYIHDKEKCLNWAVVLKLARDIAQGMRFMHNFRPPLIHRDLKSPNVLLTVQMTEAGYPSVVAKVADFGLSRSLMLAPQLSSKAVDNPVWLAPELMRREGYDEKVDVYSYGVILWELVAREDFLGHITFLSAIEDAVLNGERPKIPDDCYATCPEFASLIERCWAGAATDRPSFTEVCAELDEMSRTRLPPTGATLPVLEIPTISAEPEAPPSTSEPARVTHSMPSMKYRQAARPLASVAPAPAKNSLDPFNKGKEREPPRSIQTIMPNKAGKDVDPLRPLAMRPRGQNVRPQPTLPSSASFASSSSVGSGVVSRPGAEAGALATPDSAQSAGDGASTSVQAQTELQQYDNVQGCTFVRSLGPVSAPVTSMVFLAGRVWTGTEDGKTQIWDARSGALVKELQMHDKSVTRLLVVSNKEVWSCGLSNAVKVWSAEGEYLADARTQDRVYCLIEVPGPRGDTKAHSHVWGGTREINKKSTARLFETGCIHVWDSVNKKLKKTFKLSPPPQLPDLLTMPVPLAMVYHSNHVWVASDPIILCFDPYTQVCKGYLDFRGEVKTMISVGKEIWSGSTNTLIKIWNPQERGGDCVATLEGHNGEVVNLCTNGTSVWSCGWDKQVFLWNAQAHQFAKNLARHHQDSITSVVQVPVLEVDVVTGAQSTHTYLWSGGKDCTVCMWS